MALKNIEELFQKAGGSIHLAVILDLNQWTVERWQKTGVPFKYWRALMDKYKLTADELTCISHSARDSFRKKIKK